MNMKTTLKDQIVNLRNEGKTYTEIQSALGCSKGTISYHLNEKVNKKAKESAKQYRKANKKQKLASKVYRYINAGTSRTRLKHKTYDFQRRSKEINRHGKKSMKDSTFDFTYHDVIDLHGEQPKCYLTGREIDLNKPETYSLDHFIPVSKDGDNSLDNLRFTIAEANYMKGTLELEEFLDLCEEILRYHSRI